MNEADIHYYLLLALFLVAGIVFAATGLITVPYGRHEAKPERRLAIPERIGWLIMEAPAWLGFWLVFRMGAHAGELVPTVFLVMWMAHYLHRGIIYPLRKRVPDGKKIAVLWVVTPGFVFNSVNAYLVARWLTELGPGYELRWLWSFRFLYGLLVFCTGYGINRWADYKLRTLRQPGETGYKIPRGGLYDEVSCPNYLGEIMQWLGFAIATWSLPGLAFAAFTAANLIPRAVSHHLWYIKKFPDYPRRRKAVIPYLL